MGDGCGVTEYEVSCWGQSILTEANRRAKMNVVINRGLKRIQELKTETTSSERIIEDVDLALKALEISYRVNGAAVEGMDDRNGHSRKVSVGELQGLKVRGVSAKKPKICSCTLIC